MTWTVRWRGQRHGGVSLLLEVLFGVGLFATAMLMIFGVFPTAQRSLAGAKNLAVANDLARRVMEEKKSLAETVATRADWDAIIDEGPITELVPVVINGVSVETEFNWELAVADLDVGPPLDRKGLTVTVRWEEGPRLRSVVLETFVARSDLP